MSQKTCDFSSIFAWFCALLQEPTSKKRAPAQCFVDFSHNSMFRFWRAFLVRKTYQKPFQKGTGTPQKSMSKTCCFLTSIFWSFGLDLGASWVSKLEPSWLKITKFTTLTPPPGYLKLTSLKNAVLEGSRLHFGGPGSRFCKLWGQFFRDFGMLLAMHAENLPRTCRELAEAHEACLDR